MSFILAAAVVCVFAAMGVFGLSVSTKLKGDEDGRELDIAFFLLLIMGVVLLNMHILISTSEPPHYVCIPFENHVEENAVVCAPFLFESEGDEQAD